MVTQYTLPKFKDKYNINSNKRMATNIPLFIINLTLKSGIAYIGVVAWLSQYYLYTVPTNIYTIVLGIILLDFVNYVLHYLSHKTPFLWKFHELHHTDQVVDATTLFRDHPLEVVLQFVAKIPVIFLFAIPLKVYLLYKVIDVVTGMFAHANVRVPESLDKILSKVFNMPSVHSIHHHSKPSDCHSNYGFIFSFWDTIFKTRQYSTREDNWQMGLKYGSEKPLYKMLYYPFTKKFFRDI